MGIRRLLTQWTTKTLGGSTKLSVDDYHLIQDPVHIEDGNIDAFYLTNAVGQATNTQSQSGPMPGTGRIEELVSSSSGVQTLFRPDAGEVWQLTGVSTGTSVNATIILHLYDGTTKVELGQETGVNVVFNPFTMGVVYVDNNVYLAADYSSNSGETKCVAGFIRVR